jgi:hypothetical protein
VWRRSTVALPALRRVWVFLSGLGRRWVSRSAYYRYDLLSFIWRVRAIDGRALALKTAVERLKGAAHAASTKT